MFKKGNHVPEHEIMFQNMMKHDEHELHVQFMFSLNMISSC